MDLNAFLNRCRSYNDHLLGGGLALLGIGLVSVPILNTTNWWNITLMVVGGLVLVLFLLANLANVKAVGKRRSTAVQANLALVAAAMLGIVLALNYIVSRHPIEADLTSNKVNTLSQQTIDLLKRLTQPVDVTMVTSAKTGSSEIAKAQDLLRKYAKYSSKFSFRIVDGDRNPTEARKLNVTSPNTVVFESGNVRKDVQQREFVTYALQGRQPVPKFQGEGAFTSALLRMVDSSHKVFYFTEGHGEKDYRSPQGDGMNTIKDMMEKQNFTVNSLNLLTSAKVPDDANVIAIIGPQKPFQTGEQDLLRAFVKKGGKIVLCLDPLARSGLDELLKDFGLKMDNDVVVDFTQSYPPDPRNIVPKYMGHSIVEMLSSNNIFSVMPFLRSIRKVDPGLKGATQALIVQTTANGFGMTDFKTKALKKGPNDLAGPLDLGYACEYTLPDNPGVKARLVAFGGSNFMTNNYLQAPGNGDLGLNSLSWAAEEENKISIHPKEDAARVVNLTSVGENLMFYLFVVLIPIGTLLTGAWVWYRRRAL